ncbi:hypothetical protein PNOK_0050300 [Pyrrhoderma noxium]|uniref:Uncharacterized protein n=1 Tax=Pyrrhoderma noxium TaxID=2282107 RepID=A0A286UVG3_9AGAM|nr:hypothetical protein PNOK_0050300 [Pyrrhoderma noxium]
METELSEMRERNTRTALPPGEKSLETCLYGGSTSDSDKFPNTKTTDHLPLQKLPATEFHGKANHLTIRFAPIQDPNANDRHSPLFYYEIAELGDGGNSR